MTHINILWKDQLGQAIAASHLITIVDFWAERCGPCRMLGPILDQVAEKYPDTVQVAKVNVDDQANQELAMSYQVMSIPRVIFFIDGKPVEDFVGVQPLETISMLVDKHLPSLSAKADQAPAGDNGGGSW